jgi:hypothetical protein
MNHACLALLVLLGSIAPLFAGAPFTRVVYDDDPVLKVDRALARDAFGGDILAIPTEGQAPRKPRTVAGILLHSDPAFDPDWVMGDRNPMVDYHAVKRAIPRALPGVGDIDDKWHEYRFVSRVGPEIAPPRMRLGSSFDPKPKDAAEKREVEALVAAALGKRGAPDVAREQVVRLELYRRRMFDALGKAIVKVRLLNHSEGRLPKTTHDWIGTYLLYVAKTKPEIERIQREIAGTSAWLQERIFNLPHIEGRTLEALLEQPGDLIVQEMIGIEKEVRMHVVEGKVLRGATFLRFYPVGQYLSRREIARIEDAMTKQFLARLPPELAKLSFTPDMVIETGGRVRILDFNCGIESGYYWPTEDVITSNLLVERLTRAKTPLLAELDAIYAAQAGREKVERIRAFLAKYAWFRTGDVEESFWDRILAHYVEYVGENPTARRYGQALEDLKAAGLTTPTIYLQFIAECQATWPKLALPADELAALARRLHRADPEIAIDVTGHQLAWREIEPAKKKARRRATTARPAMARRARKAGPRTLVPRAQDEPAALPAGR